MEDDNLQNDQVEDQGVLLYYKYVNISDTDALVDWFQTNCTALCLLGRVRVSPEGINVTVGGKVTSLEKHITAVESNSLFKGCDFKLASCQRPLDRRIAEECGFTSLSVRAVKAVVTLHSHPSVASPSISNAGKHLSATEFHSILQTTAGGKLLEDSSLKGLHLDISLEPLALQSECEFGDYQHHGNVVVLDARNAYETRIGKFLPPKGVQTLEPNIRQYSDLPAWIDSHADELRGNRILMYCTGGVRCEMASAYIRMKGSGYENVYQLSGGIQRYLEAYPDGGFFKGKNFVFDHRISVGSFDKEVIGLCLLCHKRFDDYSSRCRCSNCRMLVLVCNQCRALSMLNEKSPAYICELCHKNGHNDDLSKHPEEGNNNSIDGLSTKDDYAAVIEHDSTRHIDEAEQNVEQYTPDAFSRGAMDCTVEKVSSTKKLKILCLHGFRQNASNLKGRLGSFTRKLKHLAEFVFVDAPHELPFIYQSISNKVQDGKDDAALERCTNFVNLSQPKSMLPQNCNRKRAWLIAPNCHQSNFDGCRTDMTLNLEENSSTSTTVQKYSQQYRSKLEETNWIQATSPFDPLQYQQQTVGWQETLTHLQEVFSKMGPFDGVLGFSQGASVAATLCTLRQRSSGHNTNIDFEFLISCSGFPSPLEEFQQFISNSSMLQIDCPSLHIFGGTAGLDRQIMSDASTQLASLFRSDCCVVLKHSSGHIIPTQSPYIDKIKDFLLQFL